MCRPHSDWIHSHNEAAEDEALDQWDADSTHGATRGQSVQRGTYEQNRGLLVCIVIKYYCYYYYYYYYWYTY